MEEISTKKGSLDGIHSTTCYEVVSLEEAEPPDGQTITRTKSEKKFIKRPGISGPYLYFQKTEIIQYWKQTVNIYKNIKLYFLQKDEGKIIYSKMYQKNRI